MTPSKEQLTEDQILNSVVEWYEPRGGLDEDGEPCTIHVTLRSSAADCVKAARHHSRQKGSTKESSDSDALHEFLAVNWGVFIDSDSALRKMSESGHVVARDVILMALWNPNGVGSGSGALSKRTGIDKTRVSQVIKNMEGCVPPFVMKTVTVADRRKGNVYLTTAGQVAGKALWDAFRGFTRGPDKRRWYGMRADSTWKFIGDVPERLAVHITKAEGLTELTTGPPTEAS